MRTIGAAILMAAMARGAETKVKLEDLPAAVQGAVREQTRDATIGSITAERERGRTTYEVEAKRDGKRHNLVFDQNGRVVETEDEVELATLPPAARSAIEKRAAAGRITLVEKVTAGATVSYEATIRGKDGRRTEYAVNEDGSRRKVD